MQRIGVCQQLHIGERIDAGEAGTPAAVALQERSSLSAALDPPGEPLTRITAHSLEESQHHRIVRSVKAPIAKAPYGAPDEAVALLGGHRKIHRCGSIQKGVQLRQGL